MESAVKTRLSAEEEAEQIMDSFRRNAAEITRILNDKGFQRQWKKNHRK